MTATGFFGAGERAALLRDPEAFAARAEQVLSASVSKLRKLEAEHAAERIETEQARSLPRAAPPSLRVCPLGGILRAGLPPRWPAHPRATFPKRRSPHSARRPAPIPAPHPPTHRRRTMSSSGSTRACAMTTRG